MSEENCHQQWSMDLSKLEEETASVLQTFGSSSKKKVNRPSTALDDHRFGRTSSDHRLRRPSTALSCRSENAAFATKPWLHHRRDAAENNGDVMSTCRVTAVKTIQEAFRRYRKATAVGTSSKIDDRFETEYHDLQRAAANDSKTRLFRDDGIATVHLRDSISRALKTNTFDSISAMLAHEGLVRPSTVPSSLFTKDEGQRIVSTITMSTNGKLCENSIDHRDERITQDKLSNDMSLREICHAGFGRSAARETDVIQDARLREVCFNCWSAGQGDKCGLQSPSRAKTEGETSTKPFCGYWSINTVRRKYRSEEIEANRATTLSSIRFAKDQRRKSALAENASHPIFKSLTFHVANVNFRSRRRLHLRRWFQSFVDYVKLVYNINEGRQEALAQVKEMRRRHTGKNSNLLNQVTLELKGRLPQAPITGFDPMEPDIFFTKKGITEKGEIIERAMIIPQLRPHLPSFRYHTYLPPAPTRVELGQYHCEINSNLPLEVILHGRFSRKGARKNLARGGLSAEVVLSQEIISSFAPQHGNFNINNMDNFIPDVTPESFVPLQISEAKKTALKYVERGLDHILDRRQIPTIIVKTGISPDDRHYFGLNRPEQTGETDENGFRTSESWDYPDLNSNLDTLTFVPADGIATPNATAVLPATATRVDLDYPFCKTKSRVNKITDLAHMLDIEQPCSPNRPQIHVVMTKQQPGKFMRGCDPNQTLGRLETHVTRSWSFVRKRRVAMFQTDDGVPYWYDRRTGQTWWERPLYNEESLPIKEGGILLGNQSNRFHGDVDAFKSSSETRSNMRKAITSQYESKEDTLQRERAAKRSMPVGVAGAPLPIPVEYGMTHEEEPTKKIRRKITYEVMAVPTKRIEKSSEVKDEIHVDKSGAIQVSEHTSPGVISSEVLPETDGDSLSTENLNSKGATSFREEDLGHQSNTLVSSIAEALGGVIEKLSSEKDILRLGVGLGMSLGAQGLLLNLNGNDGNSPKSSPQQKRDEIACSGEKESYKKEENFFGCENVVDAIVNHDADLEDANSFSQRSAEYAPASIAHGKHESELAIDDYLTYTDQFHKIELKNLTDDAAFEFLDCVTARRVGKQYVDYIDSTSNLPESKPVGRVKPRPAGKDWRAIGFDPWSAGKDLLTVEFIPSLTSNASLFLPDENQGKTFSCHNDALFASSNQDRLPSVLDAHTGQEEIRHIELFSRLARCIRHGNFAELDSLLNDAEWSVPIDYTDDVGNTLLMICCQNGNKRMVKLCLRTGCDLNKQNINGHTCLHYAFGYGFDVLGEYLISKGADDSITNADGLTCYEGLRIEDVSAL